MRSTDESNDPLGNEELRWGTRFGGVGVSCPQGWRDFPVGGEFVLKFPEGMNRPQWPWSQPCICYLRQKISTPLLILHIYV